MAEICCGIDAPSKCDMEIQRITIIDSDEEIKRKRQKIDIETSSSLILFNLDDDDDKYNPDTEKTEADAVSSSITTLKRSVIGSNPKFGVLSVCGRRREMEDAYAIHSFLSSTGTSLHFVGVYDGHGCSHVATMCKERLHEIVKAEVDKTDMAGEWEEAMRRSFSHMEDEVSALNEASAGANCKCELRPPECGAVGSTAVVAIVTPEKIIVANCGDSRAVISRNGQALPLSNDHKPDRPDELARIQNAGGRVLYWDGARVLGVLAMSRAIGDAYLKPYVCCEPEVTVIDRGLEDECLILASDGLWDVVSNDMACSVARMCLRNGGDASDKACSDASVLLTRLALARKSSDNITVVVVNLR